MEGIYQWGITVIKGIQGIESPPMTVIMRGLSFLGTEYFYFALLPLVFWCIDEKKGIRLGIILILSAWINLTLKSAFKAPRPFNLDPSVGRAYEQTYGLPSGHAQNSLVFWTLIASWGKRKRLYAGGLLLVLLIGLSRLYLGVHFPTDLFAGWLLALLILGIYGVSGRFIEKLLISGGTRLELIGAALLAFLMNALYPEEAIPGGLMLGMGLGYGLMKKHLRFSAQKGLGDKKGKILILILRFLLGMTVLALLYRITRPLLPGEGSAYYRLAGFCRFALLGLWVYAGAPWLFLRLRLAEAREGDRETGPAAESPDSGAS
ncbi:MAG: phosphatase PAP2 family protein [Treponema sp.]|jgi:membrane-associated phospholipid phosphatase|nr:phosphatase PAP2 family protein [Treponema sp.]